METRPDMTGAACPAGCRRAAPPLRAGWGWLAAASALAGVYMLVMLNVPQRERFFLLLLATGVTTVVLNPRVGFFLPALPFAFALAYPVVEISPFHPTAATLIGLMVTAYWIVDCIVWNRLPEIPKKLGARAVLLALMIQIVSIFVSIHVCGQHAWNAIRDGVSLFLFMPVMFVVIDCCRDHDALSRLMKSIVLATLAVSVIGVMQYFGTATIDRNDAAIGYTFRQRVTSTLPGANVLAGYFELTLPVAMGVFMGDRSRVWRIIGFVTFILGFICNLFTFSRGGFFMTTAAAGFLLVFHFRRKPLIPVLAAVLFVYAMATNSDTFARQLSLVTTPRDLVSQPTLVHRVVTYDTFWNGFLDSPVHGIGWGAQEFFWGRTLLFAFWDVRHAVSTTDIAFFGGLNSLFLNLALKGGLISLTALLLVVFACIRISIAALQRTGGLLAASLVAGLIAFAGHQLVDNLVRWPQTNAVFWVHLGLLGATAHLADKGRNRCASS